MCKSRWDGSFHQLGMCYYAGSWLCAEKYICVELYLKIKIALDHNPMWMILFIVHIDANLWTMHTLAKPIKFSKALIEHYYSFVTIFVTQFMS